MDAGDRSFSISEIRKELARAEAELALQQRRVDALRKMAEGADELELTEREMSPDGAAEAPPPERPSLQDPGRTGARARVIVQSDTSRDWTPRQVWEQMVARGWAEPTRDARSAVRVALNRLAEREERLTRTQAGLTYAYRWVAADPDLFAHGSNGHAPASNWEG